MASESRFNVSPQWRRRDESPLNHAFADHAILITGASDGIGAELARQLSAQGAWLALAARRSHELDVVAQECIALGGRAIVVPTDVTEPAQCEQFIARALEAYGKIDVLVNNAGVGAHFAFESASDMAVFDRVMRVNYLGSVHCTHVALAALKATRGRVVAISSLAGKTGVPGRSAYAASKHAMQGFFDSLRIELQGTGVTVTVVCPGFVQTHIRRNALGGDGKPVTERGELQAKVMPVAECVRNTVIAMERRDRELVMTPWPKMMAILRVLAPGYVDGVARKRIGEREAGNAERGN